MRDLPTYTAMEMEKLKMGYRFGRPIFSACIGALLLALIAAGARDARADATPSATPAAGAPAAAAKATPAPVAAATPVPPLSSPGMTGPLVMASPHEINIPKYAPFLSELPAPIAGLLDFDVNGVVSGLGFFQNRAVVGDPYNRLDISNAEAIIQKADGMIQYYVQVGGYSLPALGSPYVNMTKAVNKLYGVLPEAYLKVAPFDNFSIEAGNLPTLFGAEYTFTFENMNIERGLLWNQENAINRGVQLNYSYGPLAASVSWNNGFYSHSYTWVDGLLAWTINPQNTLSVVAGGNAGFAKSSNFATPLLNNNGQIYNLIYTYNAAPIVITPYFQETNIPFNPDIGVLKSTQTISGAILASYAITDKVSVAGRAEYIGTTGNENSPKGSAANLLYGVGSDAWSLTLTPTFQWNQFFFRGEVSYVQANSYAPGAVFGKEGINNSQVRGLVETGVIF
ncbi:MAG TPA: outer membrane beta-barrel protein [Candidatus Binataceae bacterium]|nr:outer membrane beta-barrel protein [Candidatus Binataceae bacterium]